MMARATGKTFRSGNSEAVRLPRDLAFGADVELTLIRSGDVLTIYPSKGSIADLVATLNQMPRPDSVEIRDEDLFPERPGL
ncbi:AbrB/MazE/SpoVT family DNA-binding domain-containing protein [Caulobacter vibrioides]|nr:AbrB/MazE/SpoVT family DNA-binding domain-containing protein [Caulobacter vibrioides]YP_002515407.1 antitoxin protein VapB [Caulobacter vibrioides NA1000]ACL93499.1 antitoxin protein VapB [Caulobacter vibrioides NA1000]QXZ52128.1 AbrB/MazE/SpoVT family DNA-binding domain-containing protein [Caulobacter vibrioides]